MGETENSEQLVPDPTAMLEHRRELEKRKTSAFRVFEIGEKGHAATSPAPFQRELAELVDRFAFDELPFRQPQEEAVNSILQLEPDEARRCLAAWAALLGSAGLRLADRRQRATLLGKWIVGAGAGRDAFVKIVGAIARRTARVPLPNFSSLAAFLGRAHPEELAQIVRCAEAYADALGTAIDGLPVIVRRAVHAARVDILDALLTSVPPKAARDDPDGPLLLKALADLSREDQVRDEDWSTGVDVVLRLASRQISSGFVAARSLPAALRSVPAALRADYLEDLLRLEASVGIGMVGFGFRKLPGLYGKHGTPATRRFVATAVAVAERHGLFAAYEFLNMTTRAARRML